MPGEGPADADETNGENTFVSTFGDTVQESGKSSLYDFVPLWAW